MPIVMSEFNSYELPLGGLKLIQRNAKVDERGYFARAYCKSEFNNFISSFELSQLNLSLTKRCGTVRGMHYQTLPFSDCKFVSCIRGKIWDVAIDIRPESPTYLHWHAEELSELNQLGMYIPNGFAHGFQALSDDVQMLYMHSLPFSSQADAGLNPLDPSLNIDWPLPISLISVKDSQRPFL